MPDLPHDALLQLRRTHVAGVKLLKAHGFMAEPVEVAIQVERHRWFWRPSRPRILLVAESHVFTSNQDMAITIDNTKLSSVGQSKVAPPPDRFVRLVYCLGYGEPGLLTNAPKNHCNPGTENYWTVFGRVAGRPRQARGANRDDLDLRLRWKIETLRQMCREGIWLLDASVHAVYRGNGNRLPLDIQCALHAQWWDGYGRHVVASCGGAKIWVIGKTVSNCLSTLPGWRGRRWIYQPNYDTKTNWPELLDDCGS